MPRENKNENENENENERLSREDKPEDKRWGIDRFMKQRGTYDTIGE